MEILTDFLELAFHARVHQIIIHIKYESSYYVVVYPDPDDDIVPGMGFYKRLDPLEEHRGWLRGTGEDGVTDTLAAKEQRLEMLQDEPDFRQPSIFGEQTDETFHLVGHGLAKRGMKQRNFFVVRNDIPRLNHPLKPGNFFKGLYECPCLRKHSLPMPGLPDVFHQGAGIAGYYER